MNIIYSNATTVHAYVGEENYGTDETGAEAMALLKDLQGTNDSDVSSLNETSNIDILNKFFSRSYFVRLWIVQELLLAQSITLHCGQISREISNNLISQLYEQTVKVPSWVRFAGKTESQSQRTHMSLKELLASTGVCRMTDLRDRVFGLLGLVGDGQALDLSPNYELMVREVYIGVAAYLMEKHECCDLIQHTNPYWIKDKWRSPNVFGIPSWVPTWDAHVPLQASHDLSRLTHQIKSDCEQRATERLQLDCFAIRVLEGWPHGFGSRCRKTGQRCKTVYAESAFLATSIEIVFRFKSLSSPFTTQPGHAGSMGTPHTVNETDDHEYVTNFWHLKRGLILTVRSFAWVLRLLDYDKGLDEFHLIRVEGCTALFVAGQRDGSPQYRLIGPCVAALLWQTDEPGHGESFKFDDLRLFSWFKPLTVEMVRFMAQWRNWVFEIARSRLTDGEHTPSVKHQSGYPSSTGELEQSYPPRTWYDAFLNREDWKSSESGGELHKQLPTLFEFWHDVHELHNCFNHWESSTNEVRVLIAIWKTSREVTPRVLLDPLADWRDKSDELTRAFEKITGGDLILQSFGRAKLLIETLINSVSRAADTNLCDESAVSEIIQDMESILLILNDDRPLFNKAFPSELESIHPEYSVIKETMEWREMFRGFLRTETEVKRVTFY
ncbi:hypothetical protein FSARC_13651 [Fusarium sarcochroum]|uniref:Heterokaryon incompatibility domain-containing protein n=1 Tax=Fusarium sarcochroum TaxID=1208366 RepID=A0A8H4SZQ4_9HYPO|nr:hypothetical protein FSARC_13651 [Fusarium sarcochroum]